jgi:hypothetical protein
MLGRKRWSFRFRWRLGRAGAHNQWRERIAKVRLSDLLKWLVDFDGLGWPCRMHDEDDGSDAAAPGSPQSRSLMVIMVSSSALMAVRACSFN